MILLSLVLALFDVDGLDIWPFFSTPTPSPPVVQYTALVRFLLWPSNLVSSTYIYIDTRSLFFVFLWPRPFRAVWRCEF